MNFRTAIAVVEASPLRIRSYYFSGQTSAKTPYRA
jgi:hypothetical protein